MNASANRRVFSVILLTTLYCYAAFASFAHTSSGQSWGNTFAGNKQYLPSVSISLSQFTAQSDKSGFTSGGASTSCLPLSTHNPALREEITTERVHCALLNQQRIHLSTPVGIRKTDQIFPYQYFW
jgi:hypothetical protein